MHGLINRSIQCFVRDTYGDACWAEIAQGLDLGPDGFESMLSYDDGLTDRLVAAVARVLDKPPDMVLEDVGTYLVSHPNTEAIRRLLRFGGETFTDFLHSLDDLPDRAALAVPDLELPALELIDGVDGHFALDIRSPKAGFACVLVGILRALADDYGALVFLDQHPATGDRHRLDISLLDSTFAEGRSFSLARPPERQAGEVS